MHTQINDINLLITPTSRQIAIDNQGKEQKQVVFGNWGCTINTYEKLL